MREIKYRAWDKKEKRLGKVLVINFVDSNVILDDLSISWLARIEHVILEQWTGLKDKNGKLIFKGSLVKYTEEDGDSFIAEVKYFAKDGYPAFDVEPPNEFDFESNVLSVGVANNCLEVVGDIHNNHDLLEVSE